jgi:hypothetical protein
MATFDTQQTEDLNKSTTVSIRENLEYNKSDNELQVAIDRAIEDSMPLKKFIDEIGKRNKKYWMDGTDQDVRNIHKNKAKIVTNRIFTDVETAIPILTSEVPEPTVVGVTNNATQEKIQKGLQIAYEVTYKLQSILQTLLRHWFLFRLGVIKYRWDIDKGFTTENVLTRKIGIDSRATTKENCEYIFEELEDKVEILLKKFPNKKREILQVVGDRSPKSKVKYIEFWGGNGEWLVWKLGSVILEKKKNPNFDYEDLSNNIFEQPQFPYLFLNVFSLGDDTSLYDNTSLIEQSIPLQDGATQEKRQILDLNEGQKRVWVTTNVEESVVQSLINKTGDLAIRTRTPNAVQQVQSGKPDAALFNDVANSLSEIDNVIGIHSTTRGSQPSYQETLGAQKMQMGADMGRLDLIVRNVEQVIEEWYNSYLHMIKVYSIGPEILSNGKETIELQREDIPTNILIMVKKGSTLPIDRRTKYEEAQQLSASGMIPPRMLYEEMGYPDPEKIFQELIQWYTMTGRIIPQQPQGMVGQPQGQSQPQPQPQGGGQPQVEGQPQGGGELEQLQQIMQSPEFQASPPEAQKKFIAQSRRIVEAVKNKQQ